MKLLSPEELEKLAFPNQRESTKPLKKVMYIQEDDANNSEGNSAVSQQRLETTRFNLFTGYQTVELRDQSVENHWWKLFQIVADPR